MPLLLHRGIPTTHPQKGVGAACKRVSSPSRHIVLGDVQANHIASFLQLNALLLAHENAGAGRESQLFTGRRKSSESARAVARTWRGGCTLSAPNMRRNLSRHCCTIYMVENLVSGTKIALIIHVLNSEVKYRHRSNQRHVGDCQRAKKISCNLFLSVHLPPRLSYFQCVLQMNLAVTSVYMCSHTFALFVAMDGCPH